MNLNPQDVTNLVTAITALVVAVEVVWSRLTHRDVKQTKEDVKQTKADVTQLKNGELKKKVREALTEHDETRY